MSTIVNRYNRPEDWATELNQEWPDAAVALVISGRPVACTIWAWETSHVEPVVDDGDSLSLSGGPWPVLEVVVSGHPALPRGQRFTLHPHTRVDARGHADDATQAWRLANELAFDVLAGNEAGLIGQDRIAVDAARYRPDFGWAWERSL